MQLADKNNGYDDHSTASVCMKPDLLQRRTPERGNGECQNVYCHPTSRRSLSEEPLQTQTGTSSNCLMSISNCKGTGLIFHATSIFTDFRLCLSVVDSYI